MKCRLSIGGTHTSYGEGRGGGRHLVRWKARRGYLQVTPWGMPSPAPTAHAKGLQREDEKEVGRENVFACMSVYRGDVCWEL